MTMFRRHVKKQFVLLFSLACLASGCGYAVGPAHQQHVRSVHVPIFKNEAFRRGYEFTLTEAVQREIRRRTPFQLADPPYADTILKGRIIDIRKDGLGEAAIDQHRNLQLSLAVEVTWEDANSGRVLGQDTFNLPSDFVHLVSTGDFAPEVGQSLATATQTTTDRMARQIIEMMESPW